MSGSWRVVLVLYVAVLLPVAVSVICVAVPAPGG
jgi:hypothetical protein